MGKSQPHSTVSKNSVEFLRGIRPRWPDVSGAWHVWCRFLVCTKKTFKVVFFFTYLDIEHGPFIDDLPVNILYKLYM